MSKRSIFMTALLVINIGFITKAYSDRWGTTGPRTAPVEQPPYKICSPYTLVGEPCIWQAGIDIPIASTGLSHYTSMVTLVLPPANPGWELYRSDFNFTLDFVYQSDCKNNVVSYKNDAFLYRNDTVCK